MSDGIKIISNNIKCLQDESKHRKIFHYFNILPDTPIIMLQESHSTQSNEFGGKIYYSYGTSEARCVCIIITNNIAIEVKDIIKDTEGRYIQLNVMLEGKSLSLINLYGPNKYNAIFFKKL